MIEIEKKMNEVDSLTISRPLFVLVVSGGEGGVSLDQVSVKLWFKTFL